MTYLILLIVALLAALAWHYYEYVYPIPDDDEAFSLDIDQQVERFSLADECKRACYVVIAFCALMAALTGASSC